MKVLFIAIALMLGTTAQAQIMLTPYIAVSEKQMLSDNYDTVDGIVRNFAIAEKLNIQAFRYPEFDKAITSLNPALVWATLKYLNDNTTGARYAHVENYVQHSQIMNSLAQALTGDEKAVNAIKTFETLTKGGLKGMPREKFMELVNIIVQELLAKKA